MAVLTVFTVSWHVVYLHMLRSSDEHRRSHTCLGTGMRVEKQNGLSSSCILWTFASATLSVYCVGWTTAVSRYCPQMVAKPSVGRNHGWAMGISRRGHNSGPTVRSGPTAEIPSSDSDVHLPPMETRPPIVARNWTDAGRSRKTKTKRRRSKRPSSRHRGTSQWKRPSCPTWHGGSLTFNNWKMHCEATTSSDQGLRDTTRRGTHRKQLRQGDDVDRWQLRQ